MSGRRASWVVACLLAACASRQPAPPSPPVAEKTEKTAPDAGSGSKVEVLSESEGAIAEGELCLSCHSAELIATSRIALAGWTAEITKMRNWGALVDEDKAAPLAAWFAQKYPLAEREPSAAMISAADAIAAVTPEHEKPPARGDPQAGASLYAKDCASCHGPHAEGLGGGPVLIDAPAIYQRSRFSELVLKGKGRMPAAQGIGDREIGDLLAFLRQLH